MGRRIDRLVDAAAIIVFSAMLGCVLAQVVFRYFLNAPLVWSDELARYLFVWASFLGWIVAARRRSHLAIDMLVGKLGPRGALACRLFAATCAIAFAGLLAWYGARIAQRNWDVEATSLAITVGAVYAIVPLAAIAVGLYAIADAARAWRAHAARAAGRA
ncbi:MAG: TRAP transporter small permease [Burkholderiales bacterium]